MTKKKKEPIPVTPAPIVTPNPGQIFEEPTTPEGAASGESGETAGQPNS
jgi:hypothetical protein